MPRETTSSPTSDCMSDIFMTSTLTPKCHLEIDENTEIVFSDSSPSSWTLSKGDTEENDQQTESTNEVVNAYLNPIQDTPDETSQQFTYDNIQQNWQDIYPSHFYQSYQNYETQQLLDRQLMPPPFPQLPERQKPQTPHEPSASATSELDTRTAAAILLRIKERIIHQQQLDATTLESLHISPLEQAAKVASQLNSATIPDKISVLFHQNNSTDVAEFDIPSPVAPELSVGQYENLIQSFSMLTDIMDYSSYEDRTRFTSFLRRSMIRQYERFITPIAEGKVRKSRKA